MKSLRVSNFQFEVLPLTPQLHISTHTFVWSGDIGGNRLLLTTTPLVRVDNCPHEFYQFEKSEFSVPNEIRLSSSNSAIRSSNSELRSSSLDLGGSNSNDDSIPDDLKTYLPENGKLRDSNANVKISRYSIRKRGVYYFEVTLIASKLNSVNVFGFPQCLSVGLAPLDARR